MPPGVRWTRARYVAFLQATLAVVSAAEPAIAAVVPELGLCPVGRTARLRDDLVSLGAAAFAAPVAGLGPFESAAAAYGTAYVVEGSQMGGLAIGKAVAGELTLGHDSLSYLLPPGGVPRWRRFVAILDDFGARANDREWRDATASAVRTFDIYAAAFRDEGLI